MIASAISRLTSLAFISTDHRPGLLVPEGLVSCGGHIRVADFFPSLLQCIIWVRWQNWRRPHILAPALIFRVLSLGMEHAAEFLKALNCAMYPVLVLRCARLEDTEWIIRNAMRSTTFRRARKDNCTFFRLRPKSSNYSFGDASGSLLAHPRRHGRQEGPRLHLGGAHLLWRSGRVVAANGHLQSVRLHTHAFAQRPVLQPRPVMPAGAGRLRQVLPHCRCHVLGLFCQGSCHNLFDPQAFEAFAQF